MLRKSWLYASLAASVFALSGWAASSASFNSPRVYEPGGSGVVAADFNHDGKLDLAVRATGKLVIWMGNGKDAFDLKAEYSLPGVSSISGVSLAAGDFSGDGKLDLVAISGATVDNIAVLIGNGDGTFRSPTFYTVGDYAASVAIADFNGDGKPDFAVSVYVENTIAIFLNNGNGTFTALTPVAVNVQSGFAAADFNGDGKADLAVSTGIMLGNGDAHSSRSCPIRTETRSPSRLSRTSTATGFPTWLETRKTASVYSSARATALSIRPA